MKPLDRLGDRERAIVEERRRHGYRDGPLGPLAEHGAVLRRVVDLLLPGIPDAIDLASFVDSHVSRPMGRGDRHEGVPAELELFQAGLRGLAEAGFLELAAEDQLAFIGRMRRGEADDSLRLPAREFIDRLLDKALAGYLAHPDTWVRIGFHGPAYPQGYAWIGPAETKARHEKARGWRSL